MTSEVKPEWGEQEEGGGEGDDPGYFWSEEPRLPSAWAITQPQILVIPLYLDLTEEGLSMELTGIKNHRFKD